MSTGQKLKLKRLLMERNITLTAFSKMIRKRYPRIPPLGVDRISRYTSGVHTNIHLSVAVRMAKTLGVSLDDIVDDM